MAAVALALAAGATAFFGIVKLQSVEQRLAAIEAHGGQRPVVSRPIAVQAPDVARRAPIVGGTGRQPAVTPPAAADEATWRCAGSLTQPEVTRTIGAHGRQVFECFEQRQRDAPGLAGTVIIKIRVDQSGRPTHVNVDGTLEDAALRSCIASRVGAWAFPQVRNGDCAIVEAPFRLGSSGNAGPP